jgi:hypothetical protein
MRTQVPILALSLIFFSRSIYFMSMSAWPACMYGHHMHFWCLWRSEKGTRSPEVGVIDDCEPPRGGRESNMGPLHEQQVLNH